MMHGGGTVNCGHLLAIGAFYLAAVCFNFFSVIVSARRSNVCVSDVLRLAVLLAVGFTSIKVGSMDGTNLPFSSEYVV